MTAVIKAAVAAVLVQPLVLVVWVVLPALLEGAEFSFADVSGVLALGGYVWFFAAGFVLVLGIPLFLILRRMDKATRPWVSAAGFAAAAIPMAIYTWPFWRGSGDFSSAGGWHGRYVEFVRHGEYTLYGWLNYAEGVLMFGVHGLVGAMVFLLVWRKSYESRPGAPADAGTRRG